MSRINELFNEIMKFEKAHKDGITANDVSEQLHIDRSTASRYLNELAKDNRLIKLSGKPVKFIINKEKQSGEETIQVGQSLQPILEKSMAALLYPATAMPILITGETGTGKTYLAETLAAFIKNRKKEKQVPFIAFNCADYAQNAELLVGQIFGISEGAFTGATEDRRGLVEQADGGILFLDEIHRLPPAGQEMLFYLMDKGVYHRLGEATVERKANITLIGATTQNPEEALLPTLLRRFSLKLTIPPLRERTREEREQLVEKFLQDEAAKMNTELVISDEARELFLTYKCPGNIGQLKSDIQISCARAYLRYLNEKEQRVTIKIADLPAEITTGTSYVPFHEEHVKKITAAENKVENPLFPNIYQQLQHESPKQSQEIIKNYIQELSKKYRKPDMTRKTWSDLIDQELLEALRKAKNSLHGKTPVPLNMKSLQIIGLHLQNYTNYRWKKDDNESLPVVIHPNVAYRQTAKMLAAVLQDEIGLTLPEEEIELMAHFLTPVEPREVIQTNPIAILLVTHGNSTASSMAAVTNTLLGNQVIHAIDMPLEVSVEDTYKRVKDKINSFQGIEGALLLVDIGSLITMGDAIKHEVQVPIKTLSSVNLPMVLEAGRKSMQSNITLDEIYQSTKQAMFAFVDEDGGTKDMHRRMIVTVCFTGEGAAPLLESWISEQLSTMDQDVLVRTVRIDPITKDASVINELKNYYNIVAIVGTVPITISGIPYIPAWELLQQEGIARINRLLEMTRSSGDRVYSDVMERSEIPELITKGLGEILTYANPNKIAQILEKHLPPIQQYYGWDSARELGMWMHLGSLIDRLIGATMMDTMDQLIDSIPFEKNIEITKEEKEVWQPLFTSLESAFQLKIPEPVKKELKILSR